MALVSVDRRKGYYDRARETMPPAARRRYQDGWVRDLVAHAWAHAPGVRRRMERAGLTPAAIRGVGDLAKLPVLRKHELPELQKADPPFGGFCTVPPGRLRRIFVSPGPILEPMGFEAGAFHAEAGLFAGGFRPGDIVVNTFSYQMVPAAHELDEALHLLGCTVVPTGVGQTEQQVAVARGVGATGYVGTPSFLMTLVRKAEEMGGGRLPFQVAQVGAEPFPESMRRAFEDEHGIMVRQGFGTADLGMIAYEGPAANGMHLVDEAIVEVCDPGTGEPLPVGQLGEIVATVRNRTYPMIRFATGDLTILTDEPSPCGRTARRMLGWRGRADDVTKVRGMFIHPRLVDQVAGRVAGVSRSQVVVTRRGHEDAMTLRVELAPGIEPAAVSAPLVTAMRDILKLRGEVEVVPGGTIPESAKKIDDQRTWD
ncbi:MAG: phenylacetate--CoA ligase family protein [Candidatus Rokubacteria bacterium]|nr:phenylacetate--CoA ligase family protein [Candidatus Rokubacteria bacterium]